MTLNTVRQYKIRKLIDPIFHNPYNAAFTATNGVYRRIWVSATLCAKN
jgi:hypothetical protein